MKKVTIPLAACRIGDLDLVHCSTPVRAMGSPTVYVNGISWSRMGDVNHPHLKPCGKVCRFSSNDVIVVRVLYGTSFWSIQIDRLIAFDHHVLMVQSGIHPVIQMMGVKKVSRGEHEDDDPSSDWQEMPHRLKRSFDDCRPRSFYSIIQCIKKQR